MHLSMTFEFCTWFVSNGVAVRSNPGSRISRLEFRRSCGWEADRPSSKLQRLTGDGLRLLPDGRRVDGQTHCKISCIMGLMGEAERPQTSRSVVDRANLRY